LFRPRCQYYKTFSSPLALLRQKARAFGLGKYFKALPNICEVNSSLLEQSAFQLFHYNGRLIVVHVNIDLG
jgi:hypothetical protein